MIRMLRLVSVTTALALALAATLSAQAAAKPQAAKPSALLASLQGVWQMTHSNGQDLAAAGQEILITIKDNTYVQSVNGTIQEKGTFKLDESKKPLHLDVMVAEGDSAGQTQLGIVEITGKTMKGVLTPAANGRPKDFTQMEGVNVFTMVKK